MTKGGLSLAYISSCWASITTSLTADAKMKFVILAAAVAAVAFAAPKANHLAAPPASAPAAPEASAPAAPEASAPAAPEAPAPPAPSTTVVPILKDDRTNDNEGTFTVNVETGNGISLSRSGSPTGTNGSVVQTGQYSYTAPDGTPVKVTFVADENGFQPQSDIIPVAPALPHPMPQLALDQIAAGGNVVPVVEVPEERSAPPALILF
ncbi:endocuticle structural glycoprotein SgAbd-1-like [Procambarus clarkii]|uniref:endocuticle structural glycoprotein SgAbd-1-like n=1 Tax=Procambarus clarkii TaxID=6728 RepID=UPI001E678C04|nr:endocuticle structural glycoprotein SgAbd-1-like [Procambarus clarkii]